MHVLERKQEVREYLCIVYKDIKKLENICAVCFFKDSKEGKIYICEFSVKTARRGGIISVYCIFYKDSKKLESICACSVKTAGRIYVNIL